jgi:hypothetical protein
MAATVPMLPAFTVYTYRQQLPYYTTYVLVTNLPSKYCTWYGTTVDTSTQVRNVPTVRWTTTHSIVLYSLASARRAENTNNAITLLEPT